MTYVMLLLAQAAVAGESSASVPCPVDSSTEGVEIAPSCVHTPPGSDTFQDFSTSACPVIVTAFDAAGNVIANSPKIRPGSVTLLSMPHATTFLASCVSNECNSSTTVTSVTWHTGCVIFADAPSPEPAEPAEE